MQRWIVIGVVVLVLFLGGGYYGYKTYRANQPGPIWVPMPIRPDLSKETRDQLCKDFESFFADDARAITIASELKLAEQWALNDDQAAAEELQRRIFIRQGSTGPKLGDQPSINIGVKGKQKDKALTERIVLRMMKDVDRAMKSARPGNPSMK